MALWRRDDVGVNRVFDQSHRLGRQRAFAEQSRRLEGSGLIVAQGVDLGLDLDLGSLGGISSACGLNNQGQVAGFSWLSASGPAHAFLYSGGAMTDLGTLGGTNSWAIAVNDLGQVAGYSLTSDNTVTNAQ